MALDKRRHPRTSFNTSVQYRRLPSNSDLDFEDGRIENVGLGGIFIATDQAPPKGTLVELRFELELKREVREVQAKALVRWTREKFRPEGMGLEFVEFDGEAQKDYRSWLGELLKKSGA